MPFRPPRQPCETREHRLGSKERMGGHRVAPNPVAEHNALHFVNHNRHCTINNKAVNRGTTSTHIRVADVRWELPTPTDPDGVPGCHSECPYLAEVGDSVGAARFNHTDHPASRREYISLTELAHPLGSVSRESNYPVRVEARVSGVVVAPHVDRCSLGGRYRFAEKRSKPLDLGIHRTLRGWKSAKDFISIVSEGLEHGAAVELKPGILDLCENSGEARQQTFKKED